MTLHPDGTLSCDLCGETVDHGSELRAHGYRHMLEQTATDTNSDPTDRQLARARIALSRIEGLAWDLLQTADRGPDYVTPADALLLRSIAGRMWAFAHDGLN
jgi:hypothetical protein